MEDGRRVGYVSDVEGNAEYFCKYVQMSKVVEFTSPPPADAADVDVACGWLPDLAFTAEAEAAGSVFVFGGDVCDKGNGDLRVIRVLLDFYAAHPGRVFFLVGNRDVNKLRLVSELSDPAPPHALPPPYWVPPEKRTEYPAYLAKEERQDSPVARLCWILDCTMGSAGAFDRRREELAILAGTGSSGLADITDAMVYASYVRECAPGGLVVRFLQVAQIALVLDTTLFVHGGVTDLALGFVPPRDGSVLCYTPVPDVTYPSGRNPGLEPEPAAGEGEGENAVAAWVDALNGWYTQQVEDWVADPLGRMWQDGEEGAYETRVAHSLMDYGVPGGVGCRGVMYASYLHNGVAIPPGPSVREYLAGSNISQVVSGHAPHGQSPTIMKTPEGITFIIADTSYSDMSSPDNRGAAVSELVIDPTGSTYIHGVDAASQPHAFVVQDDPYIGWEDENGFRVKALREDGTYVLAKVTGFKVELQVLSPEDLGGLSLVKS